MSTPAEKRQSADNLRWHANRVEPAVDALLALSPEAWACPAADAFEAEAAARQSALAAAAAALRTIALLLDQVAAAQEAAEAAAAGAIDGDGIPAPAPGVV